VSSSRPARSDPGSGRPVVAREAATVLLARDGSAGVEILLLERHPASPMAPGAYAFPGGRVEEADSAPGVEEVCSGLTAGEAACRLGDVEPPARALGFWVAGLRELFEETGLLLARDRRGAPVGRAVPPERLAAARRRCRADAGAFGALLRAAGWRLATDRMAYWAHWITPEERPVRYDARFFVAAALDDAAPEPDREEVVGFRWLTAAAALAAHAAGELTLPMVTQRILGSVADYPTVAALLAAAPAREVRAVRPRIVLHEGRERILLPEDPGWF